MDDTINHLKDIFSDLGEIRARKMFGGYGLYYDDAMFALVADGEVYLKVDEHNQARFDHEDLPAFSYEKAPGKTTVMSYRLAPETIYDDPIEAAEWAWPSCEAAKRAKAKQKPKKKVTKAITKKTTQKNTKKSAKVSAKKI